MIWISIYAIYASDSATPLQKRKKERKKLLVTCDRWHVTHDMWHVTHDRLGEVNPFLKFYLPSFHGLGVEVFWRYFLKDHWLSEWVSLNEWKKVFVEQPQLHRVC